VPTDPIQTVRKACSSVASRKHEKVAPALALCLDRLLANVCSDRRCDACYELRCAAVACASEIEGGADVQ
jgi:hypothetical protein